MLNFQLPIDSTSNLLYNEYNKERKEVNKMFYTSVEEYVATMSDEEYFDIMMEAFADEMAEAADAEPGM